MSRNVIEYLGRPHRPHRPLTPNVTVSLTGVVASTAIGTFLIASGIVATGITGVSAHGTIGSFTTGGSRQVGLGGVSATGSVQSPGTSRTLATVSGVSATTAVGSVGLALAPSTTLTGVTGTTALGGLTTVPTRAISGVSGTGSVGSISAGITGSELSLTGVGATTGLGSLLARPAVALTTVVGTSSVGTLTFVRSGKALTGVSTPTGVGMLTPTRTIALTGVNATTAVGIVTYSAATNPTAALTSVTGTMGQGAIIIVRSKTLTGNSATGAVGGIGSSRARGLSGVAASGVPGGFGGTPLDSPAVFVATTGSNTTGTGTLANPWRTIPYALTQIGAGLTVYPRVGTYTEYIESVPSGTSWSNKVRIAAYPGETVWIKPPAGGGHYGVIWIDANSHYVEFDGIRLDATLSMTMAFWLSTNNGNDPHHFRFKNAEVVVGAIGGGGAMMLGNHTTIGATGSHEIQNVTIHGGGVAGNCGFGCSSYGVYVSGPNNLVEHCTVYDVSGSGIQVYNGGGDPADYNIIRSNRVRDIIKSGYADNANGIIVSGSHNQIYNNVVSGVVYGSGGIGIVNYGGSNNGYYNNTIYGNQSWAIQVTSGDSNNIIQNNIFYGNGADAIDDSGTGTTKNHNLLGTDPLFVNAGTGNFHLQAGSPAIDTGATITTAAGAAITITNDFDGTTRPQGDFFDIGAFEYPSGTGFLGLTSVAATTGVGSMVASGGTIVLGTVTAFGSVGTLTPTGGGGAGRVTRFTDDFNRADESPLVSPWAGGYTGYGNAQVVSQEAQPVDLGDTVMTLTTGLGADQWAYATITNITGGSSYCALVLRAGAGADATWYEFSALDGLGCRIVYRLAGVNTAQEVETPATTTWAAGDILLAQASGTTLTLYKNTFESTPLVTMTDSALANGRAGIMPTALSGATSDTRLDDLMVGDFSGMSTRFSDDFTRADENPLASPWIGGYTGYGNVQLVSGEAQPSGTGDSVRVVTTALAGDQWAYATIKNITNGSSYCALVLRAGSGADATWYEFSARDGVGCRIVYRLAGVNTAQVAESPSTTTWADGDILLAEAVGTTLNLYKNTFASSPLVTMTHGALTGGRGGIMPSAQSNITDTRFDDFFVGDFG